jgi:hypothetical protein
MKQFAAILDLLPLPVENDEGQSIPQDVMLTVHPFHRLSSTLSPIKPSGNSWVTHAAKSL